MVERETPHGNTIHACPWCDGEDWTLKTTSHTDGPRLRCNKCNAGFKLEDIPECLSENRRMEVADD